MISSEPEDAHRVDHVEHRAVVAVRDHASLRRPGGARRVDEGADVVGRRRSCSAAPSPPSLPAAPALGELAERDRVAGAPGHPDHVLELRAAVADPPDLLQLLVVLDHDRDRVGVLEHVLALLRRVGLVDRDHGRARGERGEVEVGPLGPGVGEDRDLVALLDPELDQPERQLADDLADLGVGLRRPLPVVALVDHGPLGAVLADRRRQQIGERRGSGRGLARGLLDGRRFHQLRLPLR